MKNYLELLQEVLDTGTEQENRTGTNTIAISGATLKFDLTKGFPAVSTKKLAFNAMKGELLAFIEGATSAKRFRELGCNFWDQNANENKAWLANPNRKGEDDLGKIYGSVWRNWPGQIYIDHDACSVVTPRIDQLQVAIDTIKNDPTNRRIIISAWRPDMFDQMALAPCHVLYQFNVNIKKRELNLCMFQRSADLFLGAPMNIASASLLLSLVAKITGYTAKYFTHFISDAHIYVDHIDQVKEQLSREPLKLPELVLAGSLVDINMATPGMIWLENYKHHPAISGKMAV